MANSKTVLIKIKRQDDPNSKPYWEEFELPHRPGMNVTSSLMDIAANPVTKEGKKTTPVTDDSNCLEEVCGACAMLINGQARMACSALIDKLEQPVKLEPFSKFPVVRDLSVDRSVLFENLKKVKLGCRPTALTISAPAPPIGGRAGQLSLRAASHAAAAWKPVRSSTTRPASSELPPSRRCACSTITPQVRR
jgi:hypothetical protein